MFFRAHYDNLYGKEDQNVWFLETLSSYIEEEAGALSLHRLKN